MPDGLKWIVERDASVTDPAAEVVSPVCRWEDIEMVQAVVRCIKQAGARVDSSCGIHIHVGLGDHTPQSLRQLVNIVNAKEDLLTMALGISPNRRQRWCKPVDPNLLRQINLRKPTSMNAFAAIWYRSQGGFTDWTINADDHYNSTRYHLLNLHATFSTERPAHTIEFRAFNGTLHAGTRPQLAAQEADEQKGTKQSRRLPLSNRGRPFCRHTKKAACADAVMIIQLLFL